GSARWDQDPSTSGGGFIPAGSDVAGQAESGTPVGGGRSAGGGGRQPAGEGGATTGAAGADEAGRVGAGGTGQDSGESERSRTEGAGASERQRSRGPADEAWGQCDRAELQRADQYRCRLGSDCGSAAEPIAG